MNRITQEIMRQLKIDLTTALRVHYLVDCSGIDYSECTQRELDDAIRAAYAELFEVTQ